MAETVFRYVRVYPLSLGSTLVEWGLHRRFNAPGPYTFTVERSRSGPNADDWIQVAQVTDSNMVEAKDYDTSRHTWSSSENAYYRVVLSYLGGPEYESHPEPVWGSLQRRDWLLVRNLYRIESLSLRKTGAGTPGYLLRRRDWGELCTKCIDPNTRSIVDPMCSTSYGTEFVGGYFPPIEYWVSFAPGQNKRITQSQLGTVTDTIKQAKCLAYPVPRSNDIWVSSTNNKRYNIRDVTTQVEQRGVPVVLAATLSEIPPTDIRYKIEIPSE